MGRLLGESYDRPRTQAIGTSRSADLRERLGLDGVELGLA